MPTFIPNGPFVPDRLVQQLEDDQVVIFCGAGISMGAGLPSYTIGSAISNPVRSCSSLSSSGSWSLRKAREVSVTLWT